MQPVMTTTELEQSELSRLLTGLADESRHMSIPSRGVLYEPTDPARNIYLVLEGQIRTQEVGPGGSRRLVEILGPGDWCGSAALAQLATYEERAESAADSVVAVIGIERLNGLLMQQPAAMMDLVKQLARKLGNFRVEAAGLVFNDCKQRLVHTLQRLSDSPAASRTGESVVLRITHQQLAQAVGVARETVSLALSQLRRRNLLRTGRNQLMFNPEQLQAEEKPE
jgi:CRP-like cAMP-binding protein